MSFVGGALRRGLQARGSSFPSSAMHFGYERRIGPRSVASPGCIRFNSNDAPASSKAAPVSPTVAKEQDIKDSAIAKEVKKEEPASPTSGLQAAVKRVSNKIEARLERDGSQQKQKENTSPEAPDDTISKERRIKKAEKQKRRREERGLRPWGGQVQRSLQRAASDSGLAPDIIENVVEKAETRIVRAYCVAESLSYPKLRAVLDEKGYYPFTSLSEDCIHVSSHSSNHDPSPVGDIFIFIDNGTVVTWGLSDEENLRLLEQIKPAQREPYRDIEDEELNYIQDSQLRTGLTGETIIIGYEQDSADSSTLYAKLAFSNGIARSTKLAVLEEQLETYLDSTREIPRILARGNKLPWGRSKTLQKVGELLAFRGELNLHSELTETPDLYWAKPQLEEYYNRISRTLDVPVRITILNKKLDYANELAATLRSHLSEQHGLALEWGIIGLIAIEVLFGIIELLK